MAAFLIAACLALLVSGIRYHACRFDLLALSLVAAIFAYLTF